MCSEVKTAITLPSGSQYPVIGLGTHNSTGGPRSVREAVKYAISIGYRSVDCAYAYENESEVGEAIQAKLDDGTIKEKSEIFITTKIWGTYHNPRTMRTNFRKSLQNLQVEKVQLLLIHWPVSLQLLTERPYRYQFYDKSLYRNVIVYVERKQNEGDELFPKDDQGILVFGDVDVVDAWKGMEDLVDAGLVENIGLSNFNKSQIERICKSARIKPCNLQIEIHPYFSNRKLVDYCQSVGITVTAYAPLANPQSQLRTGKEPDIFKDPVIKNLSKKTGKSIAQIVLRFLIQRNIIVIPKSITPSRIKENFDVFSFSLTEEDMKLMWSLDQNLRIWRGEWVKGHKEYPFNDEY